MAYMTLDKDERRIVYSVIRGDLKRQKRIKSGKGTDFDTKVVEAIEKAKEEVDLGQVEKNIRDVIIEKIYVSIQQGTPWEMLGETYCCRSLFYSYRKRFCYLVAVHLGIKVKCNRKEQKQRVE